jgi:AcrR family transcriptional regulator
MGVGKIEPAASARRGRPRDHQVDERILAVAKALYSERGWSGFNFDVVAKRARVSKDALYRRYSSTDELLVAAMAEQDHLHGHEEAVASDDTLCTYLLAIARDHFGMYTREEAFDYLRIYIEAPHNPDLLVAFHDEASLPNVHRIRSVIRGAMAAGILPHATSSTTVLDAIIGGIAMHVMVTPPDLRDRMIAGAEQYLQGLVAMVLRGCGYDDDTPLRLGDLTGER